MTQFAIQINNKGGTHYRKYTKDTLQMLYDVSPSAANFEMMIVIEGLIFMAVRSFYIVSKQEGNYGKFIENKKTSNLFAAIEKLYNLGIVDKQLKQKLHSYREQRNEIAHDFFQLKSVFTKQNSTFRPYPFDKVLKDLFDLGMDLFVTLGEIVTPGLPTKEEYLKRFSGHYRGSKSRL